MKVLRSPEFISSANNGWNFDDPLLWNAGEFSGTLTALAVIRP